MKQVCYKLFRYLLVLGIIMGLACAFLFILGQFIVLHPNAYRDLLRSILMVTAFILLFYQISLLVAKILKRVNFLTQIMDHILNWWEKPKPLKVICDTFTLVTGLNSWMMVTGRDIPKEGIFAYIHIIFRFCIIGLIVGILMWHDIESDIKKTRLKSLKNVGFNEMLRKFFSSVSYLFTTISLLYCSGVILLKGIIVPEGGFNFYKRLLIILAISLVIKILKNIRQLILSHSTKS